MNIVFLCNDVLIHIMIRLTAKELFKMQCVSRKFLELLHNPMTWAMFFQGIDYPKHICNNPRYCLMYIKYNITIRTIRDFINNHIGDDGWKNWCPLIVYLQDEDPDDGVFICCYEVTWLIQGEKIPMDKAKYKIVSLDRFNRVAIKQKKDDILVQKLNFESLKEIFGKANIKFADHLDYPKLYLNYDYYGGSCNLEKIDVLSLYRNLYFASYKHSGFLKCTWPEILERTDDLLNFVFPNQFPEPRDSKKQKQIWCHLYSKCEEKFENSKHRHRKNGTTKRIVQTMCKVNGNDYLSPEEFQKEFKEKVFISFIVDI